ncbi:MAG: DNA mismatch repair endonuclease MutL [Bacteroidetes bacterium]|nr:DNA mismatch repair endonuclease MutL [Bacteroidota bacterium]
MGVKSVLMGQEMQIRRMPIELANKIAAGEVVQRPASALKELLENAIDAKATEITVSVKASGSNLIQVSDNGTGMGPEDAVQCFERHATSKITQSEDLENIRTLGFRGEALASIAAIAQVTLNTKRGENVQGTQVRIDGGQLLETSPSATTVGTIIEVRNLFFNVPARRSFLKAPTTEFRHISEVFIACALANPWVTFRLDHEKQEVYRLICSRAENFQDALRERLRTILGPEVTQHVVSVDESTSYISVQGYLAHPEHARKSRKNQYLFVNGRSIKSASIHHAIRTAYDAILPEGRQPVYVLFLTIDPHNVDVNVHPSKLEVRFDDDRGIYNFVQAVCRRAFGIADLIPQYPGTSSSLDFQREPKFNSWKPPPRANELRPAYDEQTSIVYEVEPSQLPPGVSSKPDSFLWQIQERYILTQLSNGVLVVDQKAAHQRILYERALEDMRSGGGLSQQLLFHHIICLTQQDCDLLHELAPQARALGFDYSISENRTVTIQGVPSHIRTGAEKEILQSILDAYKENTQIALTPLPVEENMARSLASRCALQSGVKLNEEEMRTLIDRLFECQEPSRTPNGKPTFIRVTLEELKHRFGQKISDHDEVDQTIL